MGISAAELLVAVEASGASAAELSILGVAAAVTAAGVASVKLAADFQQGVNRLVTGAGDVTDNMAKMGQGILGVSTATGVLTTGTDGLNAAMYQIISAGQRGAQSLNTLSVAAKGAQSEQAAVVDVSKALTTAMTDYGTKTFNATQFMNGYTRAVQLGKISLEQLSNSMGPILPLAQNLGIHFADVAAAMSTMTNAGIPAERAATSLRFAFQSLENPTHKARVAMADMGLSTIAVANEMKTSLPGALQMIYDAAKKVGPEGSVPFNRAVSDMIGGQRSLSAFLALTGTHMSTFVGNTKAITDAMNASKTAVLGWDLAQTNFNVILDRANAAIEAMLIGIGSQLLPVLGQILGILMPLLQAFSDWITKSQIIHATLQPIVNTLNQMVSAFRTVFNEIQVGGAEITKLSDQFMHATDVLNKVKDAAKPLYDAFDRARGIIKSTTDATKPLTDSFDRAKAVMGSMSRQIDPWVNFWREIKVIWDKLTAIDWGKVGAGFTRVGDAIYKIDWGKVGAAFSKIADGISKIDWGNVGANFQKIAIAIANVDWGKVGDNVVKMSNALSKVDWGGIGNAITVTIKGITQLVSWFQWAYHMIVGGSIVPDLINGVVKWFQSLPGKVIGVVQGFVNSVVKWFQDLPGRVGTVVQSMVDGAVKILGSLAGRIPGALSGVWGAIVSPFQRAADAVSGIIAHILGMGGGIGGSIGGGGVGHFAGGTSSAPGGLAMIGEQGPELMYVPRGAQIIPNNRIGSSGGGGSSSGQPVIVQFNINGQQFVRAVMPDWVQAVRQATGVKF